MRKQGAEKIISVYWFAILFIVAAAMVYMVYSYYGKPYDVREIEADLLADKVSACLNSGGYIRDNWQGINGENILAECGLNFNVEDTGGWKNDQYYVELRISSFVSGQSLKTVSAGNSNLKINCDKSGKTFPVCLEREMYAIDKANTQYKIDMLSIVRKTEKNVQ